MRAGSCSLCQVLRTAEIPRKRKNVSNVANRANISTALQAKKGKSLGGSDALLAQGGSSPPYRKNWGLTISKPGSCPVVHGSSSCRCWRDSWYSGIFFFCRPAAQALAEFSRRAAGAAVTGKEMNGTLQGERRHLVQGSFTVANALLYNPE